VEQANPKRVLLSVVAACVAGMLVGSAVTSALIQQSVSFPTSGLVVGVGVGVYSDSGCTQNLTSISWGNVAPGGSVTRSCYVKNTGNSEISLSMATAGWSPSGIGSQVSVIWDREGAQLGAGQVVLASFTLSVLPGTAGTAFSFTAVVTGSG